MASSSPIAAADADGGADEAAAAAVPASGSNLQETGQSEDAVDAAAANAAPAAPNIAFGINWDQRVKVYADMFLVEKLRPHQREGVKFVFECLTGVRQEGMYGAVLADGMGLGKTFQTIASLWCLLTKGVNGQPTCRKPLILCPTSLVQNWGKELKLWLGDRVVPVVVDDTRAEQVKKSFQEFRAFSHGGKPKVLVMSYPCFRMHKAEVYRKGLDVVMCDEAHFLKNGEAQISQAVAGLASAKRRLLMSGTPIQNDLSEFHAVFDLACPGLLGDLKAFNRTYEGPIQRGRDADATEKQVTLGLERMEQLMKLCNKFMLRRTSTVLKALLPAKVEQQQQQQQPEEAEEDDPQQPAAKEDTLAPLVAITALKKLCCHPDLIWEMLNKHKVQAKQKAQQQALLEMMHAQRRQSSRATGVKCYTASAADSDVEDDDEAGAKKGGKAKSGGSRKRSGAAAAGARQQLSGFEGCEPMFGHADIYPKYQAGKCQAWHSGKVMVLEALLKGIKASEPTDKVVLVSNYTEALDVLGGMCASHGWPTLRLDGSCSVKQRQALVDTFNDPQHPSFVLLLSSKAGGVGLNIIGANRLVLFDPDWNPANDLQAMARVWREGQKKRVWIYRLLIAGSIEEKVLQRQLAKQGLSEALVDDVGQQVRTFSRDELRSLFRVDPTTPCDTHKAIKCSCSGTLEDLDSCKERAAAAAAAAAEGGGGGEAEQQGVLGWAHLARAMDSPDPTWQAISDFVRNNFVTYIFSDHVLDDHGPPRLPDGPAGHNKRKREADDNTEDDEEQEEDEEQSEEDRAGAGSSDGT
ncbi:hypothetical protein OEZ86_005361 [Tetradesmus obliquus]|nr:hypothetical protein OEZ86_005361 [Tetradesmus obliquus]